MGIEHLVELKKGELDDYARFLKGLTNEQLRDVILHCRYWVEAEKLGEPKTDSVDYKKRLELAYDERERRWAA